ncbi:hypothetical protein CHS0354_041396 [Potamilus streckersoni]|uniref:G-protein coupled receptors family 1 profile domain-containing protein n=1 Tax=Potamilus streckersoni TaxID=2493646 RepID=A0AAE0WAN8_9BIVA|nr:hypothetical protein CHS0354_041396 [Potamilus streckersoni]
MATSFYETVTNYSNTPNVSDDMYYYHSSESIPENYLRWIAEEDELVRRRAIFRVMYLVLGGIMVLLHSAVMAWILSHHDQRKLFVNWLYLHMSILHIIIGLCVCPFLSQLTTKAGAGLQTILCKIAWFISDIMDYLSLISVLVIGVHHCLEFSSPSMLEGVSRTFMAVVMIGIPWVVVFLLTLVLRLMMTVEIFGDCYVVEDQNTKIVWIILSKGIPFSLLFLCFLFIVYRYCKAVRNFEHMPKDARFRTIFSCLTITLCLLFRVPNVFFIPPLAYPCSLGRPTCETLDMSLDQLRLIGISFIPLAYLTPKRIKSCYKHLTRKFCYAIKKKKTQRHETIELQ